MRDVFVMRDVFIQTIANLRANRLRSFLTMFGIAWGMISIVVLAAVGEGFGQGNQKVIRELGKNILIIRNGRTSLQAGGARAGQPIRLTIDDVYRLQRQSRLIEHISPELIKYGLKAKSAFNASMTQASGVWPVYQYLRTIEVDRGRLLSVEDCAQARRVVLIGFEASKQLFADRNPVGASITLNGIPYTVVGRVRKKEQDSNYTGQDDTRLFMPWETARKDFPMGGQLNTPDHLSTIIAGPKDEVLPQLRQLIEENAYSSGLFGLLSRGPVENEVRQILSGPHNFDPADIEALNFWNTAIEAVMFDKMTKGMEKFLFVVGVVTLLLGGIGVMNIMLVAVRERTVEIGVRKALGATATSIQWQFFSEALVLTALSGLIGVAIGAGICGLINLAPMPTRFNGMIITWPTVIWSAAMLTGIGVAAALYPARRASMLPPIEALRYDGS